VQTTPMPHAPTGATMMNAPFEEALDLRGSFRCAVEEALPGQSDAPAGDPGPPPGSRDAEGAERNHRGSEGASIGTLVALSPDGVPSVSFLNGRTATIRAAEWTARLTQADIGRSVILMFLQEDVDRPVIVGLMQRSSPTSGPPGESANPASPAIRLISENEIVLRCGKASITLTRAGKVLIRGEYVSSRATGVNRLKGGVVYIN
jgi:hypothetical protein